MRAQEAKSRDYSDLKLDPMQDPATQATQDIPTNSTSSISSPTSPLSDPTQARAPKPFSNSERPQSHLIQDSVAVPDHVETHQKMKPQTQPQPLPQATQEKKSKLLVPEPVVLTQPASGMT